MFHLGQLVFPFAGQFGPGQLLHPQATQQRHQLERLGGRDQLAAFAQHVFLVDQPLDDARARGRGAQALFMHRCAQFIVLYGFAGAFHGTEQRRL